MLIILHKLLVNRRKAPGSEPVSKKHHRQHHHSPGEIRGGLPGSHPPPPSCRSCGVTGTVRPARPRRSPTQGHKADPRVRSVRPSTSTLTFRSIVTSCLGASDSVLPYPFLNPALHQINFSFCLLPFLRLTRHQNWSFHVLERLWVMPTPVKGRKLIFSSPSFYILFLLLQF